MPFKSASGSSTCNNNSNNNSKAVLESTLAGLQMGLYYMLLEVKNILNVYDVSQQISEAGAADSQVANNASDPWMATKETFLQSRHMNIRLKEQLRCLLTEGENIRAKNRDLQRNVMAMKAELRRINKVEKRNVFLEGEIQAVRRKLEEERVSISLEEQCLKKLKEDNQRLHWRKSVLSEESAALTESQKINQQEYLQLSCHLNKLRRRIQEYKLSCVEKDEALAKMKHESRKVEECIKEYEATIQFLEDREQAQKDKLSGFAEKKLRRQTQFPDSNLNINPRSLMVEIVNAELGEGIRRTATFPQGHSLQWVTRTWLFVWWLTGVFLTIFLASLLVFLLVLNFGVSNETVTELYHQPVHFMGYTIRPYMRLHVNGTLPE